MKNYLVTEDQLKKIVNELEDQDIENQDNEDQDEKNYNPLSSLFNLNNDSVDIKKTDISKVSSDDPVMRFFNSLK